MILSFRFKRLNSFSTVFSIRVLQEESNSGKLLKCYESNCGSVRNQSEKYILGMTRSEKENQNVLYLIFFMCSDIYMTNI